MVEGDTTGPLLPNGPEKMGGIAYLRNEEALIQAEGINLRIYGLTVRSSSEKTRAREGIQRWLNIDTDALNIVMGHRPDFILKVNDFPIDLCLAGHTHGGQIRIPFFGPLVIFSTIPRDWARGYRVVGNTRLNVSAGIGAEHHRGLPSIRLNCPPEMTLIHFLPKS
jgi:predicted MPP superfamily phosphohydrolase